MLAGDAAPKRPRPRGVLPYGAGLAWGWGGLLWGLWLLVAGPALGGHCLGPTWLQAVLAPFSRKDAGPGLGTLLHSVRVSECVPRDSGRAWGSGKPMGVLRAESAFSWRTGTSRHSQAQLRLGEPRSGIPDRRTEGGGGLDPVRWGWGHRLEWSSTAPGCLV